MLPLKSRQYNKNSNRVRPWPKTQRGIAPFPAVSPLRSARSADPWVSERRLLLARPSLNTKNRSCIVTHRPPTPTPDRIFSEWEEWSFVNNYVDYINCWLARCNEKNTKLNRRIKRQEQGGDRNCSHTCPTLVLFFWNLVESGEHLALLAKLKSASCGNNLLSSWDFTSQHTCKSFSTFPTALCHCLNFSSPVLVPYLAVTPTWSCMQQQAGMSLCVKNRKSQGPAMCKSDYATKIHWSAWGYRQH